MALKTAGDGTDAIVKERKGYQKVKVKCFASSASGSVQCK